MITVRVDKQFKGPSLQEVAPLLGTGQESIEVRWMGTRVDRRQLYLNRHRDLTLVVPDLPAMERTCSRLGIRFVLQKEMIVTGIKALGSVAIGPWKPFVSQVGGAVSKSVVIQAMADRIRRGGDTEQLRKLAVECLLEETPMNEMDLLFGLRMRGVRT